MHRWTRGLFTWVCVFVAAAVAAPVAVYVRHRLAVRGGWADVEARWRVLRERYRYRDENESARALRAQARTLGLDLGVIPEGTTAPSPPPWSEELGRFGSSVEKPPPVDIPEPPVAVSDFLRANRRAVDEIVTQLAEQPLPRWPADVGQPADSMLNGRHLRALLQLLRAEAEWQAWRGERQAAERALQAQWRLAEALVLRPDDMSSLLAIASASSVVRVLPRLEGVAAVWQQRLRDVDPYRRLDDALDINGLQMTVLMRSEHPGWYMRAAAADLALAYRTVAREMAGRAPCSFDRAALDHKIEHQVAFWNVPGRVASPSAGTMWATADRLVVEAELARKVLDLKAQRDAADGAWPAAPAGMSSSVCTGARWTYSVTPEGRMTLTFSRGFLDQPAPTFTAAAPRAALSASI